MVGVYREGMTTDATDTETGEDETTAAQPTGDVPDTTEVLILGGGAGGYVAAIKAAQRGLDVTLVERDALGGTCLNTGCIPSKAVIHGADIAHEATTAEELGISASVDVDMEGLIDWKDGVVGQLTGGIEQICQANGVTVVDGTAEFIDDHHASVSTDDGDHTVDFEYAIIATGSQPIELPGFAPDGEYVLSSTDILSLSSMPDELLVVGAGYIGMELSTALTKLGTDVTVIEMFDDVLPMYDDEISAVVRQQATRLGVDFQFGEAASEWEQVDDGIVVTTETEDGVTSEYAADAALVVAGRQPAPETVDLTAVGIDPTDDGFVPTDAQGRTSHDHIFGVGDVAGEPMLAHTAMYEGAIAAAAIAGDPAAIDTTAMPATVFTDPEIATVGQTEADAKAAGYTPVVGKIPLAANGRARTTAATDGFARIVADEPTGRLLGAQLVAPNASELIGELTVAINAGLDLSAITQTIHPHPTISEAVMEAAADAQGESIHTH